MPAPTQIEVTLVSNPEGAQLFLGKQALGESPAVATIPLGNQPVTLVARFADGAEVTQTIVPDRPIAQIAFVKPQQQQTVAAQPPPRVKAKPAAQKPHATSTDKLESRDGTMDPFGK